MKTVFITGASSGIGLACAELFNQKGWRVIGTSRSAKENPFAEMIPLELGSNESIEAAFAKAREVKGQPSAIVITTTKGKGVSYMENQAGWHGKAPNDAEYEQAMTELKAQLAELEA